MTIVTSQPTVCTQSLGRTIDDRPILRDINFHVPQGSYRVILGPNGAGKSTLLRILGTLMPATEGQLQLFGQTVRRSSTSIRSRIGMIGHQPMLYRNLSAIENLLFFGKLYGIADPGQRAATLLDHVELIDRADDPVMTFSRGMVQRLAIARALMHDPDLILADEPFAGLDVPSICKVRQLLAQLHGDGKTIILANHDIAQSLEMAEYVMVLRRGRIVIDQPTESIDVDAITQEITTR